MEQKTGSVGHAVDLSKPCAKPIAEPMAGSAVTLLPLDHSHIDELFPQLKGPENAQIWTYLADEPHDDLEKFRADMNQYVGGGEFIFWAVISRRTRACSGVVCLSNVDVANRRIEFGATYALAIQRTTATTEAWYLVARRVFELGFRRLEWKCDSLNDQSCASAVRLGYVLEGIFRQHMVYKGRNRDTAWYSVLDSEWPVIREAIELWTSPTNFDADGKQKRDLLSIRKGLESEKKET